MIKLKFYFNSSKFYTSANPSMLLKSQRKQYSSVVLEIFLFSGMKMIVVKLKKTSHSAPIFSLIRTKKQSRTIALKWDQAEPLPYLSLDNVNEEELINLKSLKCDFQLKLPFLRLMAISPLLRTIMLSLQPVEISKIIVLCDLDVSEMEAIRNLVMQGYLLMTNLNSPVAVLKFLGLEGSEKAFTKVSLLPNIRLVRQEGASFPNGCEKYNGSPTEEAVENVIKIRSVRTIQHAVMENVSTSDRIAIVKHIVPEVNTLSEEARLLSDTACLTEPNEIKEKSSEIDATDLEYNDILFNDNASDEEYIPPRNEIDSETESDADEDIDDMTDMIQISNEESQTRRTQSLKRKMSSDDTNKSKRKRKRRNDNIRNMKLTQEYFTLEESRLLWRALFPNGEDQSNNNFFFACDKCQFCCCDPVELAIHKKYHFSFYPPKQSKLVFSCNQCQFETHRRKDVKYHLLRHKLLCPYEEVTENLKVHICDNCEQSFLTAKAKDKHKLEIHFDEFHICSFIGCDEKFPHDKISLHSNHVKKEHLKKVCIQCGFGCKTGPKMSYSNHKSLGPYHSNKCATCKQEMKSWEDHVKHVKEVHNDKWRYFCGKCEATFQTKELVNEHRSQAHFSKDWKSVKCSQCNIDILPKKIDQHWKIFHPECLKCEECDKVLKNEKLMDRHKNLHRKGSIFSCNSCDWESNCKFQLEHHRNRYHQEYHTTITYKCGTCFFGFKTEGRFQKHNIVAHKGKSEKLPVRVHKCDFCHKGFFTQKQLVFHLEYNHDPILKYQCGLCKFQSQDKAGLENHFSQSNHADNVCNEVVLDSYGCRNCDQEDPDLAKLLAHIKKCHLEYRDFPHKCSKCTAKFLTKTLLHEHTEICLKAGLFECKECCRNFVTAHELQTHNSSKHKFKQSESNQFKCKYCPKNFVSKEILDRHVKIHLKLAKTCQFCGIIYCYKHMMRAHMYQLHRTDNHYLCRECGFKTELKTGLDKHQVEKHGSILKPELGDHHTCEFCEFTTKNTHSLELHANKFHCGLGKNFVCEHCSKSFLTEPELRKHRSRHTWEESYVCQHCGEKYSQRWSLTAHIRRTHLGYSNNFKSRKEVIG